MYLVERCRELGRDGRVMISELDIDGRVVISELGYDGSVMIQNWAIMAELYFRTGL